MTRLANLTAREKTLLALLLVFVLPLALWALVAVPLQENRDRAMGALAGAQADYVWVAEQVQSVTRAGADTDAPATQPVGIAGLEAALIESGLRPAVTALEATAEGGIALRIEDIAFNSLGRLLEEIEDTLGYTISDLRITPRGDDGQVDASLGLEPR